MNYARGRRANGWLGRRPDTAGGRSDPLRASQLTDLARSLGTGTTIAHARRLPGGLMSWVHALDVRTPSGPCRVVLRRYRPQSFDISERAEREWKVLTLLAGTGVMAPEPLWFDRGAMFGGPAMLLTWLPGRPLVDPRHPIGWAAALADGLAQIHALPRERFESIGTGESWQQLPFVDPGRDSELFTMAGLDGKAVMAAIEQGYGALREARRSFVHFDYWPGNTLWLSHRLTGIVDWTIAVMGYAEYDAAYCYLDLCLSRGQRVAKAFLERYRDASGVTVEPLWFWSLVVAKRAAPDPAAWLQPYRELGRTDLTPRVMRARFHAFVREALRTAAE
jgi:aminoglycoside phosphotransferase (APT) family kinase protein